MSRKKKPKSSSNKRIFKTNPRANRNNPKSAKHHYNLGVSFQKQDSLTKAISCYDILYAKVMNLWRQYVRVLSFKYHIVKYESLVDDFEAETRAILYFLGVNWDRSILNYHRHAMSRGHIHTPSYHQVTQKIYQTAKYRWRRYESYLEPVTSILKPFLDYFGYAG